MALVDHHHTGFVLRSLHAINRHAENAVLRDAIQRGYRFYKTLYTPSGLPRDAHRTHPVDIHACAEAILCPSALKDVAMGANRQAILAVRAAWSAMRDPAAGVPHYRKYRGFTSKIAYPRWVWRDVALAEFLWAFQSVQDRRPPVPDSRNGWSALYPRPEEVHRCLPPAPSQPRGVLPPYRAASTTHTARSSS